MQAMEVQEPGGNGGASKNASGNNGGQFGSFAGIGVVVVVGLALLCYGVYNLFGAGSEVSEVSEVSQGDVKSRSSFKTWLISRSSRSYKKIQELGCTPELADTGMCHFPDGKTIVKPGPQDTEFAAGLQKKMCEQIEKDSTYTGTFLSKSCLAKTVLFPSLYGVREVFTDVSSSLLVGSVTDAEADVWGVSAWEWKSSGNILPVGVKWKYEDQWWIATPWNGSPAARLVDLANRPRDWQGEFYAFGVPVDQWKDLVWSMAADLAHLQHTSALGYTVLLSVFDKAASDKTKTLCANEKGKLLSVCKTKPWPMYDFSGPISKGAGIKVEGIVDYLIKSKENMQPGQSWALVQNPAEYACRVFFRLMTESLVPCTFNKEYKEADCTKDFTEAVQNLLPSSKRNDAKFLPTQAVDSLCEDWTKYHSTIEEAAGALVKAGAGRAFSGGHAANKDKGEQFWKTNPSDMSYIMREDKFYQDVTSPCSDPVVGCSGVKEWNGLVSKYYGMGEEDGTKYLKIENTLSGLKTPILADFKLGTKSYEPGATPAKIEKMKVRDSTSTTPQCGVRATSIQLPQDKKFENFLSAGRVAVKHGVVEWPEVQWRAAAKPEDLDKVIYAYLPTPALKKQFLKLLQPAIKLFETQKTHNFVGLSLFVAYDAADAASDNATMVMKLIDFAHVWKAEPQAIDEGVLKGLKYLNDAVTKQQDSYSDKMGKSEAAWKTEAKTDVLGSLEVNV